MQNFSVVVKLILIGGVVAVLPLLHHAYMMSQMKMMLTMVLERGGQFAMPETPTALYLAVELIASGILFFAARLAGRTAPVVPGEVCTH